MKTLVIIKKFLVLFSFSLLFFQGLNCKSDSGEPEAPPIYPECDSDGWVVENEASPNQGLWAVAGFNTRSENMWAVGMSGAVLQYLNGEWTATNAQVNFRLQGIEVLSPNHIWVVGLQGTILFFDGRDWVFQESGTIETLHTISAASETSAWAVGDNGTILYFNGDSWTLQNGPTTENLKSVFAFDESNVWAVGDNGVILFFDGNSWTTQNSGVTGTLHGVSASNLSSVWAVGDNGIILYFNGTSWQLQASGTAADLFKVASQNDNSALVVGASGTILFYNSVAWYPQNTGVSEDLKGIYMMTVGKYRGGVAVGANGLILANRPKDVDYTTTLYYMWIYNNGSSAVSMQVTNAKADWGYKDNWPCWFENKMCAHPGYQYTYVLPSQVGVLLEWACIGPSKTWAFDLIYNQNTQTQMDQRISFPKDQAPQYLGGKVEVDYTDLLGQHKYAVSAVGFVSEQKVTTDEMAKQLADQMVQYMGLDPNSGWGKVLDWAIYHGLKYVLGKSGFIYIYYNYQTSVAEDTQAVSHSIGGTVQGLSSGQSLVLQNNYGDDLTITQDGSFTFSTKLVPGQNYNVTNPTWPSDQNCVVVDGSGTVSNADVTNVSVECRSGMSLVKNAYQSFAPANYEQGCVYNVVVNNPSAPLSIFTDLLNVTDSTCTHATDSCSFNIQSFEGYMPEHVKISDGFSQLSFFVSCGIDLPNGYEYSAPYPNCNNIVVPVVYAPRPIGTSPDNMPDGCDGNFGCTVVNSTCTQNDMESCSLTFSLNAKGTWDVSLKDLNQYSRDFQVSCN